MTDRFSDQTQVSNEVHRQFLRRTPIKLKQFARLLTDMIDKQVDPLRVKALYSQVNKTREACIVQGFDSTARLLNKLSKQLSMNDESMVSQKPLLKRLSSRLLEHSEKLELGVKPEKQAQVPSQDSVELPSEPLQETPIEDENAVPFQFYFDKGRLVFIDDKQLFEDLGGLESDGSPKICDQLESLGIECRINSSLQGAIEEVNSENSGIIFASLALAEDKDVLDDEAVELPLTPLIFVADEDNQENRAKAIRNGAAGFIVKPISISTICEQLESLYHYQEDSPRRVLVMEDSKAQAKYYQKVLSKGHFDVLVINDPSVLLEALRGFDPECVLMDMQMPGSSGIELTQMIRQLSRYAHLPIIFLSAEESQTKKNQALMSGGTAFIVKPVQKDQLMFMAELYSQKFRQLVPQIDTNPETNLPYSFKFKQMITIEAARASRSPSSIVLATLQLDAWEELVSSAHFSFINSVTQQLTLLLSQRLRKTDIIGHLDGGRLGVIMTSGKQSDWIEIMQNIQQSFSELTFSIDDEKKAMTFSVGLSALESNFNAHQWKERSQKALEQALLDDEINLKWLDLADS